MKLFFAIIGIACTIAPVVLAQQPNRRPVRQQQNCVTPENYYGTCVTLTYCPQVANIFQTTNQQTAQQYVFQLQRSCGTRNVNGDPVVCCTRPVTNVRTTPSPVTRAPNPFFPSGQTTRPPFVQPTTIRNPRNPQRPTSRPVVATTRRPAVQPPRQPAVQTTTTARPVTSAPAIDIKGPSCRGPDTRTGSCIALQDCPEIVNELYSRQNDETFANYLRASNRICGATGSIICCPGQQPSPTSAPIRLPNTNEIPRRLPTVQEGCGYTTNAYKKIVGGEVSKKGAWPWIALIGYDDGLSASPFKCGGSLVTARHVVTAAHCIRSDLTFVRLGEHDLSTDTETKHVDMPVVRKETHPDYNSRNGRSDIAILYLQRNIEFTDFISPICMPITPDLRQKSYVQMTPFVVGWGRTMEGGESATVLQELQIPVYDNRVCRDSYQRQNRLFSEDQFDNAVICAGVLTGGKDTCQGDSGGPLMFPEPYQLAVRYYLIGVVSYGIGCARPEVPGVYTSTQHFVDWIAQKVSDTQ